MVLPVDMLLVWLLESVEENCQNSARVLGGHPSDELLIKYALLQKGIVNNMEQGSQLVAILSKSEASKPPLNSKIDPTPCTLAKPSGSVHDLFKRLELLKFYPQQLKLQHALLIRHETLGNKPCSKTELLPYFILQKLMMNDYLCRGVLLQEKQTPSTTHALTKPQQHDDFDDFDDFDDNPDALVSSKEMGMFG